MIIMYFNLSIFLLSIILINKSNDVAFDLSKRDFFEKKTIENISVLQAEGKEPIIAYQDVINGKEYRLLINATMHYKAGYDNPLFIGEPLLIQDGFKEVPYPKDESKEHQGIENIKISYIYIYDRGKDIVIISKDEKGPYKILSRNVKIEYNLIASYHDGYSTPVTEKTQTGELKIECKIYDEI